MTFYEVSLELEIQRVVLYDDDNTFDNLREETVELAVEGQTFISAQKQAVLLAQDEYGENVVVLDSDIDRIDSDRVTNKDWDYDLTSVDQNP